MLAVPTAFLDQLRIKAGVTVSIEVDHDQLIVKPQLRPRYDLDDLLAQCDDSAEITAEDRVWFDSSPVGNELI